MRQVATVSSSDAELDQNHSQLAHPAIAIAAGAAFALAPVEGCLIWLHPQLAKLPAVVLFATWLLLRWRLQPRPQPHVGYLLLAVMAVVVLMSTAQHVTAPFAAFYASRWIPFLLLTAVLIDVAANLVPIRLLLACAVTGAVVASAIGLYSVVVLDEPRAVGPNTDPNDLACTLVASLPLILALSPQRRLARAALVVAGISLTLAAIATMSRGAMLALVVIVVYVVARRAVPLRAAIVTGALTLCVGAVGGYVKRAELVKAFAAKESIAQDNVDTRMLRWQAALRMFGHHPILGVGPGGFRSEFAAVSILSEIDLPADRFVTHNAYLEVGAELGALGFAVFLALLAVAFVSAETALRCGFDRRLAVAVQASLIANAVCIVFLSGQYFFSLWSMIAVGCAVGIRAQRGERR
jgi:O-antigen ligase